MNRDVFVNKLIQISDQMRIIITEEQSICFYNYMELLLEWNKKMNLTAIIDKEEIIVKHFIDSLTINKYLKQTDKIIDIGTGAGFPGIPLKIYNNKLNITLVDSLNKRVNFLKAVIEKLEFKNITAIHSRAEEIGRDLKQRENNDVAVSRAVAPLNILLEYMLPLIKEKGICICMKGPNIEDELGNSKKALEILGGIIEEIEELEIPWEHSKRNIIIIKKVKKTKGEFPRKAGTPSKQPL